MRPRSIPLFGTATRGKSSNVTAQRRVNLYVENFPDPDGAPRVWYGRPGLVQTFRATNDVDWGGGPCRGMIAGWQVVSGARREFVYMAIARRHAYALSLNEGREADTDVFSDASTPVCFADNGFSVLAVDGQNGRLFGYLPTIGPRLYELDEPAFPPLATSCCFIAGRYVVNDPSNPGRFYFSDLNITLLAPIPGWDALSYATAETIPDALVAVSERLGDLLLWGSRSIEFWAPSGDDAVFARIGGAYAPYGLAGPSTAKQIGGVVYFLGWDNAGRVRVCALEGYQVRDISSPDVEAAMAEDANLLGAVALVQSAPGHDFYVLNLSATSWQYDTSTGVWSEWQTEGGRYAGQHAVRVFGANVVGDYRDSRFYTQEPDVQTDDGAPMVRDLVSQHQLANGQEIVFSKLELRVETGVGLASGQGSDPQIMMRVSKTRGHTWGEERWRSLGAQGQYRKIVAWNALGSSDDWVFWFRVADPVKVAILGASAEVGT